MEIIWPFFIALYITVWTTGVTLSILVKKRIKALHPKLHAELYPTSILENNIKASLKFQKFALKTSMWSGIEDQTLLLQLKYHRVFFVLLLALLTSVFLAAFAGLAYYGITGLA